MSVSDARTDQYAGSRARNLRDIFAVFERSSLLIVVMVLLCFLGAAAYVVFAPPKFTASARLLLDPAGLQIVGTDLAASGARDTSAIEAESQIYVLTSNLIMEDVIEREKLDTNRMFGARPRGILSQLLAGFGLVTPDDPHAMALRQLDRALTVSRNAGSFVLTVNVTTEDRDTSVRIANSMLDAYLQQQQQAQSETARRASASLDARLDELRSRVRTAEERYERYRRENGIVTANGQPIVEKQASDVSGQISAAEAHVTELRASLEQIRNINDGNIDSLPEAFRGGSLETLKSRYAASQQAEIAIAATLGPRHPDVVTASMQKAEARRQLNEAIRNTVRSTTVELDRAVAMEAGLKARYDTTKNELGVSSEASVRLRELGRDVDADRGIYETYLARSRELKERERIDTSNTRILGRAVRPLDASGPSPILLLAASLILGLALGVTLAWLRDQMFGSAERTAS